MPKLLEKNFKRVVEIKANDDGSIPSEIQCLLSGVWDTPWKGDFVINEAIIDQMIYNFSQGVRKGVPIDREHNSYDGAVGWVKELVKKFDEGICSLWAVIEWNTDGIDDLTNKRYKYFSPEFAPMYEDPETGVMIANVFIGGAITNRPFLKGLQAIVASDKKPETFTNEMAKNTIYLSSNKINNEENTMRKFEELRVLKASDEMTDEEKAVIEANKEQLTDDEKKNLGIEVSADDEAKKAEEAKAQAEADAKAKADADAEAAKKAEEIKGNEGKTVTISASELDALKIQASEGAKAFGQLRKIEASEKIQGFLFNETTGGKFPTTLKDGLTDFYLSLSEEQRTSFEKIVEEMPNAKLFGEIGNSKTEIGGATAEMTTKANELMTADKSLSFKDALVKVASDNPELAERYNDEIEAE